MQMLLSKAANVAFKVYILSVHAFPGNWIRDLGVAGAVLYCCTVAQLWTTVVMLLRCFYVILKLKISSPSRAQQCFPFFSSCLGSGSIPIGIFKKSLLKSCNPQTKLDKKTKLQGCELNGFNERKDCNPVKQWYNQIKNNGEIKAIYLKMLIMYLEPIYFIFTAKNAFIFGHLQSFLGVGSCLVWFTCPWLDISL